MNKFILKVRKKGIIILPKKLRVKDGFSEGSLIIAEVRENEVLLRPLRPVTVRIDWAIVEKLLSEEKVLEEEKLREVFGKIHS